MKKFSVATHRTEDGRTEGLTIEADRINVLDDSDGYLRVQVQADTPSGYRTVAIFAPGQWLHAFDVDASK